MKGKSGAVVRIEMQQPLSPAFGGQSFGDVGTYDYLAGTALGALDPAHPLNAGIVNLARAPRNADGHVEYRSEFALLTPSNPARGNRWLLYDVINRGNRLALTRLNRAAETQLPDRPAHAGDGFLMCHGFTVVWSGWQSGRPAAGGISHRHRSGQAHHRHQPRRVHR